MERRFAPPLTIVAWSTPGERYVDVELNVRDRDFACGGSDDDVDLAPPGGVTPWRLRIDLQAHTLRMLDAFPQVLGGLGKWWNDGRDGFAPGSAELDVEIGAPLGLI
jgi:hypothetical protein